MSPITFSANQCFDQLLALTLGKLDKLDAILKQQRLNQDDACVLLSLVRSLRQHISTNQVWLDDEHSVDSPADLARKEVQVLSEQLQSLHLPTSTYGAIRMVMRALNTYLDLLINQGKCIRYQYLRGQNRTIARFHYRMNA